MDQILQPLQIGHLSAAALCDGRLLEAYQGYVERRVRFLLGRFRRHPDFPGVHTGYNALSGAEFADEDVACYGWINGRGACALSRFARWFPEHRDELRRVALRAVEWIERYADGGQGRVPFTVRPDGSRPVMPCPERGDGRTYSDLHGAAGLLEYGVTFDDPPRVATARRMLEESLAALAENRFLDEPLAGPPGAVPENPWAWCLDLSNEFAKQLREPGFLDLGARVLRHLLEHYYRPESAAIIEYVTARGTPLPDAEGRFVIDPGHSIELAGFALEFARLAERHAVHEPLRAEVERLAPPLILASLARGWNAAQPGIVKTLDLASGRPINGSLPWWSLPEALLALLLAFERTGQAPLLHKYREVNNAYFGRFLNPRTDYGPFQTLDGATGQPLDLPPACKFQDPEFHSGKNLLTCVQVLRRIEPAVRRELPAGKGDLP